MQYISTRGGCPPVGFDQALLSGLAPDGGLFLPESLPSIGQLSGDLKYQQVATEVLGRFLSGSVLAPHLEEIVDQAYAEFSWVARIRHLFEGSYMMELDFGPTFSFKDYALQLVARFFDRVLQHYDQKMVVLGATSGDTGSAAIEACRDREAIHIVILYPKGRVSEIQRRQMTTVSSANVTVVEVDGTFDDCQDLVKATFTDPELSEELNLGAVNSINWARVAAQIVYYVWAAAQLDDERLMITVPTGNFGNILSGWLAQKTGAAIGGLVVANNSNHGLTQLIQTGKLTLEPVQATSAPAMDIQVPSNLERYLFELFDRDTETVKQAMLGLRQTGSLELSPDQYQELKQSFQAGWLNETELAETMSFAYQEYGEIFDPHTAIGWGVANRLLPNHHPRLAISTAHPAKFPEAVEAAIGIKSPTPARLQAVLSLPEHKTELLADPTQLTDLLRSISF